MRPVVIATILALCAGASFGKELPPACMALQSAKAAATSGQKFEQYRVVTSDGEQLVTTPEQAIEIWTPVCQRQMPSNPKGLSAKATAQKPS